MARRNLQAELKQELHAIKQRNRRVESDKAWETSAARRGLIAVMTYFLAVILFILINAPNPWLTAFVPAAAYALSTLTLPFVKDWWVEKIYRR
ncbi:MAG: hypothetical protein Q7T16_00450 [Candidatus Burarchaeum sp.]|nr:hypothetical protein [Candidatus Burarchaeum sp.]MDO8339109.1 hypothetical protein [Candidatus Burarchaeum sp.]